MEVVPSTQKWLLGPLIDVIHGDVVLRDPCCQIVGRAFIAAHEMELRDLVTAATLPSGLQKAIEAYCVRGFLMQAPELVQQSSPVLQSLQDFAVVLKGASAAQTSDPMSLSTLLAVSGAAITKGIHALQENQDKECVAGLIDALGDAVLGYMILGSSQSAQQDSDVLDGSTWYLSGFAGATCCTTLQRFVNSAVAHRTARQRARDAVQEVEVQQLLFGDDDVSPATPPPDRESSRSKGSDSVTAAAAVVRSSSSEKITTAVFSKEVQAAMEDAAVAPKLPPHHQRLLKHPIPSRARKGRPLLFLNDSEQEQLNTLTQTPAPLHTPLGRSRSRHSTDQESPEGHPNGDGNSTQHAACIVEESPSPVLTVDPSTLTVEMSAINSPPRSTRPEDDVARPAPARKLRRTEPVLIGASETSVLRMMEQVSDNVDSLQTTTSTSSSVPVCDQQQNIIGRTPLPFPAIGTAPASEDPWDGVHQCLRRHEAEARSYFLSSSTQRFQPYAARGFFL
jgi:hypothetical protein